jgi:hypothetical protein
VTSNETIFLLRISKVKIIFLGKISGVNIILGEKIGQNDVGGWKKFLLRRIQINIF